MGEKCPPGECSRKECSEAVERTLRWAKVSRDYWTEKGLDETGYHLFGIVQGGAYDDMRKYCADSLREMDFTGYAIGGVSVGEPETELLRQVEITAPFLPEDKAKYTMGVGTPTQLLKMVGYGVDMFDCVMPSRAARHATAFTKKGKINIKNERFKRDDSPVEEGFDNYTCNNFSKAYLRHLFASKEMLGPMLLTLHNLHFFLNLMNEARSHILAGDFQEWSQAWCEEYDAGN